MRKEIITKILKELVSECENKERTLIRIFERVRDIPYGVINSRNPEDVYRKNKGTCSGKHLLLKELYLALGMQVKDVICFHLYEELPRNIDYPLELRKILEENEGVPDFHNFIQIYINNNWITLDATFDKSLEGYFVVNEWDGKSDTKLSVNPLRFWELEKPLEFKVRMLNQLPLEIQKGRELFLKKFSEWIELLREKNI